MISNQDQVTYCEVDYNQVLYFPWPEFIGGLKEVYLEKYISPESAVIKLVSGEGFII